MIDWILDLKEIEIVNTKAKNANLPNGKNVITDDITKRVPNADEYEDTANDPSLYLMIPITMMYVHGVCYMVCVMQKTHFIHVALMQCL